MPKDIAHRFKFSQSMVPAAVGSDPASAITVVDTAGFESTVFIFEIGDCDGSTSMTIHLHEGASSSPTTNTTDANVESYASTDGALTTMPYALGASSDNQVVTIQYKGTARYVLPVITYSAGTAYIGIDVMQAYARHPPR